MTETRHACKECTRTDLSLTANGRVRSHAANGKRPGPDNPNCPGGSDLPRNPETATCFHPNVDGIGRCRDCSEDLRPTIAEVDAANRALCGDAPYEGENAAEEMMERQRLYGTRPEHGGPNPYRAPLPTGNLPHDRTTEEADPWQKKTPSPAQESPSVPDPGSTPATTPTVTDAENPSTKETSSARTETAGTRDRTAAVTTRTAEQIVDAFDSPAPVVQRAEQKVERDGWGRYKLHHPETGKKQAWQRCTTFAKMLEDTFGLGKWQRRMAAKGLSLRPDLLDMVATLDVKQDSQRMDLLLEQAMDAAGQKVAANQGTVCHKHTEDVDRGDTSLDQVPVKYRADVTAYTETLRRAGITIVPQMIERITVVPDLDVGGTLDRVVRDRAGKYRVLDVKTGNMDFGQLGICIQLAVYTAGVNSAGVYDLDKGEWIRMDVPHVETDYALVAHIPVGSGTCELLKVPIDTGWEAVQTAVQVRDWRKTKRLFTAYDPKDVPELVSPYLEQLADAVGDPGTALDMGVLRDAKLKVPTWEDRFRAVASRAEAMKLYAEAEATLGTGPRLASLVQIGMVTLEQLSG